VVFLAVVYLARQFASRALRMPNLVVEIVVGILLGPPLAGLVPNPEAQAMLGEVGYAKNRGRGSRVSLCRSRLFPVTLLIGEIFATSLISSLILLELEAGIDMFWLRSSWSVHAAS
jgi:hypothetical protein